MDVSESSEVAPDGAGSRGRPRRRKATEPSTRRKGATRGQKAAEAEAQARAAEAAQAEALAVQAAAPKPRLAIDVGEATTRWALRPEKPAAAPLAGTFPSAVAYDPEAGWRAGEAALAGSLFAPEAVLRAPGRLLGRRHDDAAVAAASARAGEGRLETERGDATFVVDGRPVRPELACAALLADVVHRVRLAGGEVPDDVVLLLPPEADFAARRGWLQAAALAGLPPPRLAHGSSAAARAAAQPFVARGGEGTLCVVDVGAGGARVTVLEVTPATASADAPVAGEARDDAEHAGDEASDSATAEAAPVVDDAAAEPGDAHEVQEAVGEGGAAKAAEDVPTGDAGDDSALKAGASGAVPEEAGELAEAPAEGDPTQGADAGPTDAGAASDAGAAAEDGGDAEAHLDVAVRAQALRRGEPAPPVGPVQLRVLAHRAASEVGGEALDRTLVSWLRDGYRAAHGVDATDAPLGHGRLWSAAERARCALDAAPEVQVHLPHLTADARGTRHLAATLRRDELEAMAEPATQKLLALCRAACREAGRELRTVDAWLVVGGMAGAFHLAPALRRAFHRAPLALGGVATEDVAVTGAALAPVRSGVAPVGRTAAAVEEPAEIAAVTLARTLADGSEQVLVGGGSALPAQATFAVPTQVDEQDLVRVPLLLGAADGELAWRSGGTLEVDGLPAAPAGALEVTLALTLDAQMQLHATAEVRGQALPVRHLHPAGLGAQGLERLMREQEALAEARSRRARLEALRQDAEALLQQTAESGADVLGDGMAELEDAGDEEAVAALAEASRQAELRSALQRALAEAHGAPAEPGDADPGRPAASTPAPPHEVLASLEGHVRALRAAAGRAASTAAPGL